MNIMEASQAIEAETHSRMWAEASLQLRVLVIKGIIELVAAEVAAQVSAELSVQPEEAAKKVVKRKPRKAKAPLTQHAEGVGEYAAKLGHGDY